MICHKFPNVPSSLNLLLLSDLHIGANIELGLLQSELDWARKNKARILINGDVFDMILPSDRKRFAPSTLDKDLQGVDDIINKAIDKAYNILFPYHDLIDMIGVGNHDAITKHHHIDPVLLLIDKLDKRILHGDYCGILTYKKDYKVFYHHGWGKAASINIKSFSQALNLVEDVDMIWLGHLHTRMVAHSSRIGTNGKLRDIYFVRSGSYLNHYQVIDQAKIKKSGRESKYGQEAAFSPFGLGGIKVNIDQNLKTTIIL